MSNRNQSPLIESIESRTLMSAGYPSASYVYVESNNPNPGQNALLAYRADPTTGVLTPLSHNRFLTGGTGRRNAGPALGPDDSDKEVIATPDGRFVFAVNQGSNTVSAFEVESDGSLSLVDSSPVPSGGVEPVSLSLNKNRLYVLNRGNGAEGTAATAAPDLTSFVVGQDGSLSPSASFALPLNLSPAQVLTSADGRFEFVDDFATPSNLKVSLADTVEPFVVSPGGNAKPEAKESAGLPANPPLVLGLVEDPVHHLIYAGRAPFGGVSTFSYNDYSGQLQYVGAVASPGSATCWLNISPDGRYLYGTDSASDAISVYSLGNPLIPKLVQEFQLTGPATGPGAAAGAKPTSQDFQFSFDPSGRHLYVLNHTTDDGFQRGNQLHTIDVGSNGRLSESAPPSFFSQTFVPATAHVLGLVVVTPPGQPSGGAIPATWYGGSSRQTADVFADGTDLRKLLDETPGF